MAIKATIYERGNGLVDVGDYVAGDDGEVYTVTRLVGPIHTSPSGSGGGNYQHAEVELADWDDVDDNNEPVCSATIESDDDHEVRS